MMNAITIDGAHALTADDVLNKMPPKESTSYINGVIEGLAYSRWLRDKPSTDSMNCVYKWHYDGGAESYKKTLSWMNRHLDKPVGALLHVLAKKECGE